MLQRFADLGMALAEAVAEFPIRTKHFEANDTYNFEILSRGVRRSLALECKITEDGRRRHAREAHGAPSPRERACGQRAAKPLPPVTAEDVEPVTAPEQALREPPEDTLADTRETLLDRFVDNHTPAVVASSICRDLNIEEDLSVFREPVPTRADPWVQAEAVRAEAVRAEAPAVGERGEVRETRAPACGPPPVAKGRDPP